ncbi:hypothetical protein KHO97_03365 [Bacillus licheniformis]|jgi:hypothetical protein|uniref:Uncharacterized protein n=1 Tax=Bacillus paralicheniformis TaxID=1648923 RepID=A0AAW6KD90_9BACI|nr:MULTISPECIES: hypothetical protein [Bacillus subtilis group]KRT92211.1 hypothetical protein ACH97_211880 [Bacillus paralicheniformis]MBT1249428.1 hypothetical protein [Bacillus licheniformis]MCY7740894.1 hypothetical protein [Bacillus licheniformis]MCY9236774.1 hypothetical protein [Bacillus licheniformis]MDE1383330.1 hypothetical protein [Bacillus paralicheniformis]
MKLFTKKDPEQLYFGDYPVEIPKLTPKKWKQLFGAVDKLPGIIVQVLSAPPEDFYSYVVTGLEVGLDEIVGIVSALSDVDADYISENVGADEMFEYLALTVKKNRLSSMAKNVKSLLPNLGK